MRASGQVVQVHDIPPFSACSSKRTVRLINGIALDECPARESYPARRPFSVPIAQSTERARPKRQDAGESPAGDTSVCRRFTKAGVVQQQNAAVPRPRRRCDSVHPLQFHIRGRSSSAEHSFDMREAKRAALFAPTIFEGIAQSARADASHASGRRRESFCPHHFCPCGVAQSTCLPLMQEITGAKPVRDANFIAPKALSAMHSLGKRFSSVQLRMGAPVLEWWPCASTAVEPAFRQTS